MSKEIIKSNNIENKEKYNINDNEREKEKINNENNNINDKIIMWNMK